LGATGEAGVASSFPHLARAAFAAEAFRCSGLMRSARRLPPILPPLRPISAITSDIEVGVLLPGFSRVDSLPIWCAHWLGSLDLLGLRVRFGMSQVCHGSGRVR